MARAAVALLLATAALSAPSAEAAAPPGLGKRCGSAYANLHARTVWFRAADGARLDGAVLGGGARGVVLATEYPGDLCGWLDEAIVLARAGFRVFLFDFHGLGLSPVPHGTRVGDYVADVAGAVSELTRLGAKSVQLVGASLGGNAVLVAAPRLGRRIAGVASLSGELDLSSYGRNLDALAAVRRSSPPLLVITSTDDRYLDAADARRLFAAARSTRKTLRIYPGRYHGWDILYASPHRRQAQAALLAFLRRNAGGG